MALTFILKKINQSYGFIIYTRLLGLVIGRVGLIMGRVDNGSGQRGSYFIGPIVGRVNAGRGSIIDGPIR